MTILVTMPMVKELATFHSLPSPNTLALCDRINASVACITKQCGCNFEGTEENLRASRSPLMINGSVQANHQPWRRPNHSEDIMAGTGEVLL